jgi:hypothetical protein
MSQIQLPSLRDSERAIDLTSVSRIGEADTERRNL